MATSKQVPIDFMAYQAMISRAVHLALYTPTESRIPIKSTYKIPEYDGYFLHLMIMHREAACFTLKLSIQYNWDGNISNARPVVGKPITILCQYMTTNHIIDEDLTANRDATKTYYDVLSWLIDAIKHNHVDLPDDSGTRMESELPDDNGEYDKIELPDDSGDYAEGEQPYDYDGYDAAEIGEGRVM